MDRKFLVVSGKAEVLAVYLLNMEVRAYFFVGGGALEKVVRFKYLGRVMDK